MTVEQTLIALPFALFVLFGSLAVMRSFLRHKSQMLIAQRLQSAIQQKDKYSPAEAAYWNRQRWQ